MSNLMYLTADRIAVETGGGLVTKNELQALRSLGDPVQVISREELEEVEKTYPPKPEPWKWDTFAYGMFGKDIKLVHGYSGSFPSTIKKLKDNGAKISYSVVAHNLPVSREENEKVFGIPFSTYYPHLCDPDLWKKYIECYRLADVIVTPSTAARDSIRAYGGEFETKRIEIIPHGVDLPKCKACSGSGSSVYFMGGSEYDVENCNVCKGTKTEPIAPFPKKWRLGYCGSFSSDKGVVYILQAWKKLNYSDSILVLAGQDSDSAMSHHILNQIGVKNVVCLGWIKNMADFYNSISCYIQGSVTEGFGLEVLEAQSYGREVICSVGAGASDLVKKEWTFPIRDVDAAATLIDNAKSLFPNRLSWEYNRRMAEEHTWEKIRQKYIELWRELL